MLSSRSHVVSGGRLMNCLTGAKCLCHLTLMHLPSTSSYLKATDVVRRPYDTSRLLQDTNLQLSYNISVDNKFSSLTSLPPDIDDYWTCLLYTSDAADE